MTPHDGGKVARGWQFPLKKILNCRQGCCKRFVDTATAFSFYIFINTIYTLLPSTSPVFVFASLRSDSCFHTFWIATSLVCSLSAMTTFFKLRSSLRVATKQFTLRHSVPHFVILSHILYSIFSILHSIIPRCTSLL